VLYPFRTAYQAKQAGYSINSSVSRGFHIPSKFDPAPLLYPIFLPLLVSISLASMSGDFILLNVILGLSSLPAQSVPFCFPHADLNLLHWLLTLLPVTFRNAPVQSRREVLTLLYPLHIYTLRAIEYLTMTSLDPAEQQLLAAALIDLYIFAQSAQAEILKALLWLGAPLVFILCQKPLQWELALARIPSWRFRDHKPRPRLSKSLLQTMDRMICGSLAQMLTSHKFRQAYDSEDDEHVRKISKKRQAASNLTIDVHGLLKHPMTNLLDHTSASAVEPTMGFQRSDSIGSSMPDHDFTTRRRHTLPAIEPSISHSPRTTPIGRPKRSVTIGSQSFLALTTAQVAVRKWAYAAFVYAAVLFIVLGPIRIYVSRFSLRGSEPFGWAIGYLLGNISQLRSLVQSMGLDTWIPLPDPFRHIVLAQVGWVERLRQIDFGAANARLLLSAYCLLVLLAGLATVLQLSSVAEVDTRRKVFHGTMVVMLLPTVFIDPCFTSLALILILAIFLLLDLFRAAQLPPIAKPLTAFLAPYVDGRDHRGPVIVSHIFLLTGCAIPLWLSLAAVPRSGLDPWVGWEINVRDVSMISGVVCVGMGDSAASLIGRRYGRHKWYWGGGKSLEGSFAFAVAVTVGLIVAYIWLRVGGWVLGDRQSPLTVLGKAWLAASGASLTEAVLTGANDNVVVPVALWLLVRGIRL
jgi:dolichol kinase